MDQVFLNIKSERIWFLLFVSCRVLKVSELFSLKRVLFDCFPTKTTSDVPYKNYHSKNSYS